MNRRPTVYETVALPLSYTGVPRVPKLASAAGFAARALIHPSAGLWCKQIPEDFLKTGAPSLRGLFPMPKWRQKETKETKRDAVSSMRLWNKVMRSRSMDRGKRSPTPGFQSGPFVSLVGFCKNSGSHTLSFSNSVNELSNEVATETNAAL